MHSRVALACFAFATQCTAFRQARKGKAAKPHAVKLDIRSDIADGLRLQTADDDDVEMFGSKPTFDWRAWGAEFEERTFEQPVDHLNAYHQQAEYLDSTETTFKQRYWINTKEWAGAQAKAPIFFIISPYGGFNPYAYGAIGEQARDMGAMVVQLEGRFSPGSLPFNESGFTAAPNRMGLISSENGMRDYIMLISHLRSQYDPDWVSPTITVGCSLAGMYAAWLRYKFPHIIDMAWASGSPMTGYPGTSDTLAFTRTITEAWEDASEDAGCVDLVRDSFKALEGDACSGALWNVVYNEATYKSYPPRGRIDAACKSAASAKSRGASPREVALGLCGAACDAGCPASPFTPTMWSYLSCTQVVNPIGSNGVSDFFWPPEPWNVEVRRATCMERWGIEPMVEGDYHAEIFGFHHLRKLADSVKRIIFSFGSYDAWTGFALSTTNVSRDLPVVVAKGGTHGADMIGGRADDTDHMLEVRKLESDILKRWIGEVQAF